MDDPRWLRIITIGLVLAAVAVGYFLLTGRFSSENVARIQASPSPSVLGQNAQGSPTPTFTPSPTPTSAYSRIVERTQSGTQTLPNTGFPMGLAAVFSISAVIAGWGLRKFPK